MKSMQGFKRLAPFVPGGALLYVGCTLAMANLSTLPDERIVNGIVWGTIIWVPAELLNFVLQLLAAFVLRRFLSPSMKFQSVVLSIPASIFVVYVLGAALIDKPGYRIFEEEIARPIPRSAKILDYGYSFSIASGAWTAVQFEMDQGDLGELLAQKDYKREHDLGRVTDLIGRKTGLSVELQRPYAHYISHANGRKRHLIFNTNSSTIYFLAYPEG